MKLFKYSLFGTYYYKGFTLQFTATCCLYSAHVQRPLQMDLKTRCLNDAISCVSGRSVSNHTQGDYDKKLKELVQENDAIFCLLGRGVSNHNQGDYDKKLKELEQEVSAEVADYCPIVRK
ncbi:uncharacterized protein LOC122947383 [Acropora millepora]|uniref:uncharacterized protein LOC122947383 n=1 Tax=Acropora millepora TaxID=45264 RepID=UPI001CF0F051|nr:uncharacterized protein LOC122947383 [Acropora millepora]